MIVVMMKKLSSIILVMFIIGGCSNNEDAKEQIDKNVEIEQSEEGSNNTNSISNQNLEKEVEKDKELNEIEEVLQTEVNEQYEQEVKQEDAIEDAEYSIMNALGIVKLIITVNENVTLEEVEKIVNEQNAKIVEQYPDYLPSITIIQNNKEIYSTLTN